MASECLAHVSTLLRWEHDFGEGYQTPQENGDIILIECGTTGVLVPLDQFYARYGGVDGRPIICKSCKDKRSKKGWLVDTRGEGYGDYFYYPGADIERARSFVGNVVQLTCSLLQHVSESLRSTRCDSSL
jgi:hypothetical protein